MQLRLPMNISTIHCFLIEYFSNKLFSGAETDFIKYILFFIAGDSSQSQNNSRWR